MAMTHLVFTIYCKDTKIMLLLSRSENSLYLQKFLVMKKVVYTLFKMLIFLLLLFAFMRVVFLANYWHLVKIESIPYVKILESFWRALPLDIAASCYLLILPAVVMMIGVTINKDMSFKFLRYYFYLVIAVYILIVMGEMGIYGEWRTKLSHKALVYLKHPAEVVNTAKTQQIVWLVSLWACFTLLFSWWYVRWIEPHKNVSDKRPRSLIAYPVTFIIVLGLMFIGMRGGLGAIPISTSKGYFCSYKMVNEMTVNPAYNIVENILNTKKMDDNAHFDYMNAGLAKKRTDALNSVECDSTVSILKYKNPNIVIILLESWSADLIESLGGDPSITPNFREMEAEGLLFTNFYASANRSQQAIASIYGGLPGLPVTTITNYPEKYHALPSLIKPLDSIGYYSSFYFGGELYYGNILSYLRYNKFDKIVEAKDIHENFKRGKLGIHDTDMLPWYVHELSKHPRPFFSTVFTVSTHSPYDYPKIFEELTWPQIEKPYVNSARYTDIALKMFLDEAKKQEWYDSTLFIFVADHSHSTYKNNRLESFEHHKVPMLLYGEPLIDSLKGKTYDKIVGNTDIPATLLAQLGLPHDEFYWSKDVFNVCYKPFAFFELSGGVGWKTPEGEFVYLNNYGYIKNTIADSISDSIISDGKAYMQHHFNLFNSY